MPGSPGSVIIAPVRKQDIERQQQEELKLLSQNSYFQDLVTEMVQIRVEKAQTEGIMIPKRGNHAEGNANFTKRMV